MDYKQLDDKIELAIKEIAIKCKSALKEAAEAPSENHRNLVLMNAISSIGATTEGPNGRPMTNFERLKDKGPRAALQECENDPAIMRVTWAFAEWLWMEWSEDRLTYLKRCEAARILKGPGYKELKKLKKQQKGQ